MNLLNAASEKKKRLKVELNISQKWEVNLVNCIMRMLVI